MKCDTVRPQLPSYAAGNLGSAETAGVDTHLAGCPECRGGLAATRKLRALLAFKRREQPDEFFFRTFLTDFHRRLISDMAHRRTPGSRVRDLLDALGVPGSLAARLAYGGAFAIFILSVALVHHSMNRPSMAPVAQQAEPAPAGPSVVEIDSKFNQLVLAENQGAPKSVYVLDRVAYKPAHHGSDVIEF